MECRFCGYSRAWPDRCIKEEYGADVAMRLDLNNNELIIGNYSSPSLSDYPVSMFRINFCPVCGEELKQKGQQHKARLSKEAYDSRSF